MMNDRVRIYELARQMNLTNEDIITAARELGFDVKSHSSTVDKQKVGLIIQRIGKKNQEAKEKTKAVAAKAAPAATASKTPPEVVAPIAPPVKPRVLARYAKPVAPGTEPADGSHLTAGTAPPANLPLQVAAQAPAALTSLTQNPAMPGSGSSKVEPT